MKTQIDMSELKNIHKNGYNVISTFSGCGGSSLGYKLSGYDVKCAVEFVPEAAEVYRLNFPDTLVIEKDIRTITGSDLMQATGINKFELDILDGSPPCCAFSVNGDREKGWGTVRKYSYSHVEQVVDDLFFEYIRIVNDMMPKVIIAENVKGLTMGVCKPVLDKIIDKLYEIGYITEYKVLNAMNYRVPQTRERVIIMGVRRDIGLLPAYPQPLIDTISTREAIEDLIDIDSDLKIRDSKLQKVIDYFPPGVGDGDIRRICAENNISVYRSFFRRDRWDLPFHTIVQNKERAIHPVKNRLLSIGEGKRLQTFPDDFILPHTPLKNWERIGRAVPPNLMKFVSGTVKTEILDKIPKDYSITEEEFNERYNNPDKKMGVQRGRYKLF